MAKNNWSSDAFKKAQNLLSRGYNDKDTFEAATTLSKDDANALARSMKLDMGVTGYGNTPFDDNQASMNAYFPNMNQNYQAETLPLEQDPYKANPILQGNEQNLQVGGTEDYYIQNKRQEILNGTYAPSTEEANNPWIITKFMEDTGPAKKPIPMLDKITDYWTNASTSREYFRQQEIQDRNEERKNNNASSTTGSVEPGKVESLQDKLRVSESSGRYDVVNDGGYMGAYQFGNDRLDDYRKATNTKFTNSEFVDNKELQDNVYKWHEKDITQYISKGGLEKYIGKEINGVPVTKEGMIAVAHLGGKEGLKKFLKSNGKYNPSDKPGTSLLDYLRKFQ